MEFKGISWAGNIYEKFEAMCLEVEEVLYQDTVKYVENQAQKVGASVKKFYSEVMQDLIPPSCIDPVKVAAADLSLNPYAHADINKKPKLFSSESQGELKKKGTVNEDCDLTSEESSFGVRNTNSESPLSSRVFVESTCSGLCPSKSKKLGAYRRSIGIKRISQSNPSLRTSGPTTCSSTERSSMVLPEVRRDCSVASDSMSAARPSKSSPEEAKTENISTSDALETPSTSNKILSAELLRQEKDNSDLTSPASSKVLSAKSVRQENDNSELNSPASGKILSAKSPRHEKDDSELTSPASDKVLSAESLRQQKDNSECTSSFHGLPNKPIGTSGKGISLSKSGSSVTNIYCVQSVGQNVATSYEDDFKQGSSFSHMHSENNSNETCDVELADEEMFVSYEDNFDMELIDEEDVAELGVDVYKPVEKSELDDTCVLVEDDMLHFVSHSGTEKQKSYKKKLREALSAKLRSPKKQNQSVSQYKDLDWKNSADILGLTMSSNLKDAPAEDSTVSEWELI